MKKLVALAVVATTFAGFVGAATANHSWGNYHWARTSNPFTLKLIACASVKPRCCM